MRPAETAQSAAGYDVKTVADMNWAGTKNGALLQRAAVDFDVLITVDQGIPYQQNLAGIALALIIIMAPSNDIKDLRPRMPEVLRVLAKVQPGQVVRVSL